ncbi:MAG TPA: formate--tetrahydrofolate ligase [Gemmatimonadales bacterium]|nr:formate--tetrahydrofolate ligase [Gemmatimonadales bacterium]
MTTTVKVPSDIAIAQAAKLRPVADVAHEIGLADDEVELYGRYKAKIRLEAIEKRAARGRLILVSGITPTAAGEGKSTVSVGLVQALRRLGKNAIVCLREPSLGPVFGVKGGAAGGGYAQVVPMEDINLHFTGDFHAISSAHNLLSALIDNHIHQGNALGIDTRRINWPRTMDMNDRALRHIVVGLGGATNGPTREERFVITPASEIMAILCLANDRKDLEERLARIIIGSTAGKHPIRGGDLKGTGAMALLLKDALQPNLVQTLEGGPAIVHGGPFANIAHGCNTVMATRFGLRVADYVVTEAGFGADLGAEKFFDIKCRMAGLNPEACVIVATVRALKMHGGADKKSLAVPSPEQVEKGFANLARHVENVRKFGVPPVVALNRFTSDSEEELDTVLTLAAKLGVPVALSEVWAKGGEGGKAVAEAVLQVLAKGGSSFKPLYDVLAPIKEKIETIAKAIYRADGVTFTPVATKSIELLEATGQGQTPVCMAKTQYSFTDDPTKLCAPTGFRITVRDVYPSAGAGFVVALAGDIMTMPGLSKSPAAEKIRMLDSGLIEGLF